MPTEYYGLFGLPLFTSDKKEIKAAHRRVVKLVHPDVLGVESSALQSVVTDAYAVLGDDKERERYDQKLKLAKPTLAESRWAEEAPHDVKGLFVDETVCNRCYKCVDVATSTFAIHTNKIRDDKAYVTLQYGDAPEFIRMAMEGCPHRAIRVVSRDDLPYLEYAMRRSSQLKARARPDQLEEIPGPFELLQDHLLDDLLAMDMDRAVREFNKVDPLADTRASEELSEKAAKIYKAALTVPSDVRVKLWPSMGSEARAAEVLSTQTTAAQAAVSREANVPGMKRVQLKNAVFELYDQDRDGFLYDEELRSFARNLGFDGSDAEWETDYVSLCAELGCSAVEGLDLKAFGRLVDGDCYLEDEDFVAILGEQGAQLPRAGQ